MKQQLAVALISGGLDSCVTAAVAAQNYDLAFLHLNYGQRTKKRELQSFNKIAKFYTVKKKLVVNVKYFQQIGGSSLTDHQIEVSPANLYNGAIPGSYVPFRNANILAIATSWAESINATKIFIGAVEEDSSGYPDCRESFFSSFNEVIKSGTKPETKIEVTTPLIHLSKKGIIELGFKLNAPLHITWSCYKNDVSACGICDSCALRLRGFQQAGYDDPIFYESRPSYL